MPGAWHQRLSRHGPLWFERGGETNLRSQGQRAAATPEPTLKPISFFLKNRARVLEINLTEGKADDREEAKHLHHGTGNLAPVNVPPSSAPNTGAMQGAR